MSTRLHIHARLVTASLLFVPALLACSGETPGGGAASLTVGATFTYVGDAGALDAPSSSSVRPTGPLFIDLRGPGTGIAPRYIDPPAGNDGIIDPQPGSIPHSGNGGVIGPAPAVGSGDGSGGDYGGGGAGGSGSDDGSGGAPSTDGTGSGSTGTSSGGSSTGVGGSSGGGGSGSGGSPGGGGWV